ncbi:MAG: DUF4382 domain-containing protein [Balneolaceae bacterium]
MRYFFKSIAFILFPIFLFTACDNSSVSPDGELGTMHVLLTDAPGDFEHVFIDIQEVRIHRSSDAEEGESGWITINDQPMVVDLMELTNGNTDILGEEQLEPGTYSQLRLVLGPNNEFVRNGETRPLTTPSAQQSGLKLNINAEIEGGRTYTLLLDFDASRSIVEAGNSGNVLLKPVIRAVNLAETGAIGGTIEPADAQPWIYAIVEEDTIAGTRASEEGEFLIIGLQTGTYQLSVLPNEEEFNSVVIPNIQVTAPDTTFLDPITLNAADGDNGDNGDNDDDGDNGDNDDNGDNGDNS